MQFVPLNVHFDEINTFPSFEVIVERGRSNTNGSPRFSFDCVRPMIHIQLLRNVEQRVARFVAHCDLIHAHI